MIEKLLVLLRGELLWVGKLIKESIAVQKQAREDTATLREALLQQQPPVVNLPAPVVTVEAAQVHVTVPPIKVPKPAVTVNLPPVVIPPIEWPLAELARLAEANRTQPLIETITASDLVPVIHAIEAVNPMGDVTRTNPVPVLPVDENGNPLRFGGGGGGTIVMDPQRYEPLFGYRLSDYEAGTTVYVGLQNESSAWCITRLVSGAMRYAKGTSDYATAWAARASQTYDYYSEVF